MANVRKLSDAYNFFKTQYADVFDYYSGFSDTPYRNHILNILKDSVGMDVEMTAEEVIKYRYNPKLLSYDVYGTPDLGYSILLLNNMEHISEFTCAGVVRILSVEDVTMLKKLHDTL